MRFPGPAHAKILVKLLKLEFSEQKPDLIVPVSYAAMQFLLDEGKELFPGTPVVALFNARRLDEAKQEIATEPDRTRASPELPVPTSRLERWILLCGFSPTQQQVYVVVGSSHVEKYWMDQLKQDFLPYHRTLEITYLTDLPMNEVLRRVGRAAASHSHSEYFLLRRCPRTVFSGRGGSGSGYSSG